MSDLAPQTPTFKTVESDKHRQLPWLAVILSLLVLGIIGALALQNLQLKKQIGETPKTQVTTAVQPSLAPDPTADWKTYTNTSYNFSVKYPSNLFESCNPAPTADGIRFWKMPWNCPESDMPYVISITGREKNNYLQYMKNIAKTPVSSKTITIAGIDSTQNFYKYTNEDGPLASLQESTEVIIPKGNNIIVIQQLGNSSEDKFLFDQILSTFKFTD